ncbi:MAG: LysR family transcriptional regulator [Desulfuromonadales bacterium C00003093]|nr:MAG: LysR family transcriptional regulator [Desulfuromonadales bacterium C00003093]
MDTRYLKTLVTAVEAGSFSKAATILHLTQSAVSQRIKFLEDRFGQKLMCRFGSTLGLTQAGELVLEAAYRVIALQDALVRDLQRLTDKQQLSLCCTPTFGTVFLPDVLNTFMLENSSSVDLKFLFLSPGQALEGVRNQEFDLVVVEHCRERDLSGFQTYPLPEDELVFVSAPELALSAPDIDLDELLKMRLFARKDSCSSKKLLMTGFAKAGRQLEEFTGVIVSDDLHLTCQTVLAGGGVSFMSKSLVQKYLDSGQMVAHYLKGFNSRRCRTVIFNKGRDEEEIFRNFVNVVFRVMGESQPFS